ncbi:MAG: hypothetical protein RL624_1205 [Bacteroidota bacterium]|jgi:hypothetical protein
MRNLLSISFVLLFAHLVFAQSTSKVNLTVKKHSTKNISIELSNISSDTIIIEDFNGCLKKNNYTVSNYTISNDTLTLNWSSNKNILQSSHSVNYQIDGSKKYSIIKFNPNDKMDISIKLFKNDFDKIKNLRIKFNLVDVIVVKL